MIIRVLLLFWRGGMFLQMNNVDANSRSLPAFSNSAHQAPAPAEPYVSYGAEAGSYTISY